MSKNKIFQGKTLGQLSLGGGLQNSSLLKISLHVARSLRSQEKYINRIVAFADDIDPKEIPVPRVMKGMCLQLLILPFPLNSKLIFVVILHHVFTVCNNDYMLSDSLHYFVTLIFTNTIRGKLY